MELLAHLLVFLHLLAMAVLVGSFTTQLSAPTKRVTPGQWHGALLALVTGVLLVLLYSLVPSLDEHLDHGKIAVKLLIALAIAVLAHQGRHRPEWKAGWLRVGVLSIANTAIAVFW
ncbi:MAG: hypothetical protein ACOYLI_02675 [Synechococcus lacustris]